MLVTLAISKRTEYNSKPRGRKGSQAAREGAAAARQHRAVCELSTDICGEHNLDPNPFPNFTLKKNYFL